MKDYVRIPHMRICVTDVCSRKCLYCRPGGETFPVNQQLLKPEQFEQLAVIMARNGITQLKVTGGEPMLRRDIVDIVRRLTQIQGIDSCELVTRSSRAGILASQLKDAGISCLNFSIDSLNEEKYHRINGNAYLPPLLEAIGRAYKAEIPLKFNMVVMKGVNDNEIYDLIEFAGKYGAVLKLLDLMDLLDDRPNDVSLYYPLNSVVERLNAMSVSAGVLLPLGTGTPMPQFTMANGATVLVKDARVGTWYGDVCNNCKNYPCHDAIMALRLTPRGLLQRCLLREDNLVDLWSMVEQGKSDFEIDSAVSEVLMTYANAYYIEKAWKGPEV